jgi:hypothetical protein
MTAYYYTYVIELYDKNNLLRNKHFFELKTKAVTQHLITSTFLCNKQCEKV